MAGWLKILRPLWHPLFIAGCVAYGLVKASRLAGMPIPFLNSFLSDLFLLPVALSLALVGIRLLRRDPARVLRPHEILFPLVLYSLLFELWLPARYPAFTADPWDVVAYCAGTFAYWRWMNGPAT